MEGRSIGALHAALRVGARVTWQSLQEQARRGNGNPEAFAYIGETVFWYMDELAASCSAGYAEARAELAGETSQLRRRLLDALTASPAPPPPAIESLALAAGWPLPRRVAAVALTPLAAGSPGPLPANVLADLTRRDPRLLIADPDGPGRRGQLGTALRGWLAAGGQPGARRAARWPAGRGRARRAADRGERLAALGRPGAGPRPARPRQRPSAMTTAGPGSSGARTTCPRSSCWPTRTWRRRSAGTRSRRCGSCAPARRTGWPGRCSPGWRAPATPVPPPAGCTSTRRRSATGCGRPAGCSATRSPTRTHGSGCCSPCGSGGCSAVPRQAQGRASQDGPAGTRDASRRGQPAQPGTGRAGTGAAGRDGARRGQPVRPGTGRGDGRGGASRCEPGYRDEARARRGQPVRAGTGRAGTGGAGAAGRDGRRGAAGRAGRGVLARALRAPGRAGGGKAERGEGEQVDVEECRVA